VLAPSDTHAPVAILDHARQLGEINRPDPSAALVALRDQLAADGAAALGVPADLLRSGEGTGQRESYRRVYHSLLRPLARLIEAEAEAKAGAGALALDVDGVGAADTATRARAYKGFVEAGLDPALALKLIGVDDAD